MRPHSGHVIADWRTISGIGISLVKQYGTDRQADNNRVPCEWRGADATGPRDLLLAPQERGAPRRQTAAPKSRSGL
jgi:hypothetical protein